MLNVMTKRFGEAKTRIMFALLEYNMFNSSCCSPVHPTLKLGLSLDGHAVLQVRWINVCVWYFQVHVPLFNFSA